jgi:predicted HicB family RNase H-like nuclease
MAPTIADNEELQTSLRIRKDLYRRIRVAAAEEELSINAFIVFAVKGFLDQQKKQKAA